MESSTTAEVTTEPIDFPLPDSLKEWLNGLLADVKSIAPQSGDNTTINQYSSGTQINADLQTVVMRVCMNDVQFDVDVVIIGELRPVPEEE